ncbi:MAG: hypothetical protein DA408_05970 [Bacteroidetes bacterium]|nr:MAG: hypothetical protein DA408_05970 [Bacteroidota bacterium]
MNNFQLLFICLLLSNAGTTQSILPSYDAQPQWIVGMGGAFTSPTTWVYSYGDKTQICDQEWIEILLLPDQECGLQRVGFYREEALKGWFRRDTTCTENAYLIYDFTLEVGDTFNLPLLRFTSNVYSDAIVYHRDTLPDGNIELFLEEPADFDTEITWQTGWGSSRDPFRLLSFCAQYGAACELGTNTVCVQDSSGKLYPTFGNDAICDPAWQRWYVNQSAGSGAQSGKSWNDAFLRLEQALAVASCGDEIWVATGSYYPAADHNNRELSFNIPPGVRVFGGFAGTETNRYNRALADHPTILSGEIGDPLLTSDNSLHVVYFYGADTTTVLDGFTIEKGHAFDSQTAVFFYGGGILLQTDATAPICDPVIRNCIIQNNYAQNGAGLAAMGSDFRRAYPRIQNCSFIRNRCFSFGAGLYLRWRGHPEAGIPLLEDCEFIENYARIHGGGVYFEELHDQLLIKNTIFQRDSAQFEGGGLAGVHITGLKTSLNLMNCKFIEGYAKTGAGIAFSNIASTPLPVTTEFSVDITIDFTDFINNYGQQEGGGIIIANAGGFLNFTITNSLFEGNYVNSQDVAVGLGIECAVGGILNARVDKCRFINNRHNFPNLGDGALTLNGFLNGATIHSVITNSLFKDNVRALRLSSGTGGGYGRHTVANCTFTNNGNYPIGGGYGSNTEIVDNEIYFYNNIVWEPQSVYAIRTGEANVLNGLFISHSLFNALDCNRPGGNLACGEGIIVGEDPLFIDPVQNDLHTAACSPARNVGNNGGLDSLGLLTDFDGQPRVLEGIVDLGAFEWPAAYISLTAQITPATGPGTADGAAVVEVVDGVAPYTFLWDTGVTDSIASELLPGTYNVTVTDAHGCRSALALVVSFVTSVSNPAEEATDWLIVPNPVQTMAHIQFASPRSGLLRLFDLHGRQLLAEKLHRATSHQLSTTAFAKGIYILVWEEEGEKPSYRKMIVQ